MPNLDPNGFAILPDDEPTTPQARTLAIQACTLCDTDGYRNTTVCDHTDHTQAATRGMNLIRATMGWKSAESRPESPTAPATGTPD